jgi:pimeloyl-ACP methyl ester carboxylesterase
LVACRDKLIANGADLSTYSTASIVDDIEDLRKELGIKSWNLWGVSYGSRVALTMMGGKVDGLRSVILEGVLPPGIGDQRNVIGDFARILDRVITQCNSSKNCKSRYPKLVENFNAVLERLGTYPIFINIKRDWTLRSHFIRKSWTRLRLDDVLYVSTIYNELYSSESISALPRLISASAHHNYSPFIEALQEQDLQSLIVNDVAGITIECNDQTGYSRNIQQNWQTMPPTMQRLHEYKRMFDLCDEWANVPSGETHSQPEYSRVPTLLLAGAFDPVTPAELAVQTHKLLPNSYLYVFPGNGHDASENPCAQSIMRAFLDNPDEEPVHDCLASQGPPTFQ